MISGYNGRLAIKNEGGLLNNVYTIYFILKFKSPVHGKKKHKIQLGTIFQDDLGRFRTPGKDGELDEFGKAYFDYMTSLGSLAEKGAKHELRLIVNAKVRSYFKQLVAKKVVVSEADRFIAAAYRKDHNMSVVLDTRKHLDVL